MLDKLWERFRSYPPLLQWVMIALIFAGGLILWDDLIWSTAQELDERANAIERAVQSARITSARLEGKSVNRAVLTIGEKHPLGDERSTKNGLSKAINEVLSEFNVQGRDVKEQTPTQFASSEMTSLVPTGRRGWKASAEVRFESTQADAYRVIQRLESNPAVDTVSKVRIVKASGVNRNVEKVLVQLTAEAWYTQQGTALGGGRR